jgi:outer membrane receptor protein involved in Fe transport
LNGEWYYTDFVEQVVIDMDSDPHAVSFYNLDGKSYSSTFQIEATYPFFKGFSLTAAYRVSDVKTTYNGELKEKPFTNDYKALVTASYQTPLRKWQFDVTGQFNGGGSLPDPDPVNPLWDKKFDSFTILNAQITKFFRTWSVYIGAENLLDFTQKNPIIDPQNPWGNDFDSSIVWGPLHGRKFYAGLRYNIPRF